MADIKKDNILQTLIPNTISECAAWRAGSNVGSPCMSDTMIAAVAAATNAPSNVPSEVLQHAKKETQCTTEKCTLLALTPQLGSNNVKREISLNLKVAGPTDAKLLSNFNIDAVMQQFANAFPEFFPFNFNMRNYASYSFRDGETINQPDTLATIQFADLYAGFGGKRYKCCGCVINTDSYQGPGKHWMALFADARGSKWTVEFFNSSGNAPSPEWISWLEKTKNQMEEIIAKDKLGATVSIVRATTIRHQNSRSECGLYSLFYIWARLNGVPPDYFNNNKIDDKFMFEFRQHLFDDSRRPALYKFDWNEYRKNTRIEWEK